MREEIPFDPWLLAIVFCCVCWGLNFPIQSLVLGSSGPSLPPLLFASLRFSIATLFFLPSILSTKNKIPLLLDGCLIGIYLSLAYKAIISVLLAVSGVAMLEDLFNNPQIRPGVLPLLLQPVFFGLRYTEVEKLQKRGEYGSLAFTGSQLGFCALFCGIASGIFNGRFLWRTF